MTRVKESLNSTDPNIVVIGGGTGIFGVLSGLKKYTDHITAITTMMDSGGSSGRLRDEFGLLPPGDSRQALVALTPDDKTSILLRKLFNYRFSKGNGLEGHSFGNLFLAGLTEITGGVDKALAEAGRLLGIKGKVLPVTLTNSNLIAKLEDGTEIVGETNIDIRKEKLEVPIDYVYLEPKAYAFDQAIEAINQADLVVLGPGDLFTSVIPNLLVEGISEAINSSKGKKVFICNLMTKPGESDGFKASDFISEVRNYLDGGVLDFVILNKNSFQDRVLKRYESQKAFPVEADEEKCKKLVKKVLIYDLVAGGNFIRHDEAKISNLLLELYKEKR